MVNVRSGMTISSVLRFENLRAPSAWRSAAQNPILRIAQRPIVIRRTTAGWMAIGYLLVPVTLFLAVYLHSPISVFGAGLLIVAVAIGVRSRRPTAAAGRAVTLSSHSVVALGVVATAVATLTGAAGGFRLMGDWFKHNSMIFELTSGAWPVVFPNISDASLIYSFAIYLPSAALAHLFNGSIAVAHVGLVAWMATGFFVILLATATLLPSRHRILGAVAVLLTYAGAESLGTWVVSHYTSTVPTGFWIGQIVQYSSSWTAIRWVPQHALSGWLVGMLFVMAWRDRSWASVQRLFMGSLLAALWSPFVLIAGVFLAGSAALRLILMRVSRPDRNAVIAAALALFGTVPVLMFLTLPAGGQHLKVGALTPATWALFAVLMIGPWLIAGVATNPMRAALVPAVGLLLLLPIFTLGDWNDLAMRTSIPALFVLTFTAWDGVLRARSRRRGYRVGMAALAGALLLGAPTGYAELSYAVNWSKDVPGTVPEPVVLRQPLQDFLTKSNLGPGTPIWNQYITCAHGQIPAVLGLPDCGG